jgi:hypothetical protein
MRMPHAATVVNLGLAIEISRPAPEVFAFLAAADNYPRWQEGIVHIEQLDPGPWRAGTRIRTVHAFLWWRSLVDDSEITAIEPGTAFSTRGGIGTTRYREEFRLKPRPGGASLAYTAEIEPGGVFRFIRPLAAWSFRSQMLRSLGNLKRLLDQTGV